MEEVKRKSVELLSAFTEEDFQHCFDQWKKDEWNVGGGVTLKVALNCRISGVESNLLPCTKFAERAWWVKQAYEAIGLVFNPNMYYT